MREKVELFFNGIKTVDTKLIACRSIGSHNYVSDFNGSCSRFSDQVAWLHDGAHMEAQRYKRLISEFSRGG